MMIKKKKSRAVPPINAAQIKITTSITLSNPLMSANATGGFSVFLYYLKVLMNLASTRV